MLPSVLGALALVVLPVLCVNIKVHVSHPMKFREVTVVADNATCPNGGAVPICQSAANECRDDGTGTYTRKCLLRDPSFLDSIDNSTRMPWSVCNQAGVPSKCLFNFECICSDFLNVHCGCKPFDAWRTERAIATTCTNSSGAENTCDTGKYCRTKGSTQECAPAPYLPTLTSLYSDCSDDGNCDKGLTCKHYPNFRICVNDNGATSS